MNRRLFLRNAALLAAGVVAADQLEVAERLGWTRRLFAGWRGTPTLYGDRWHDDTAGMRAFLTGKDVWDARARRLITGDGAVIGGEYRISQTIDLPTDRSDTGPTRRLHTAYIVGSPSLQGPILRYVTTLTMADFVLQP